MKHILLTGLLATAALGMSAAPGAELQAAKASASAPSKVKGIAGNNVSGHKNGPKRAAAPMVSNRINPHLKKAAAAAPYSAPAENALFESFEGWDGSDASWLPEGWSVECKGEVARADSWAPTYKTYYPAPIDGQVYFGNYLTFASGQFDDWLITPSVDVEAGNVLDFYLYIEPMYLFSFDNLDWVTGEYEGGKQQIMTLQVWAQPEGGEWTQLYDVADRYRDWNGLDLLYATPTVMEKNSVNLESLEGKKARFAFRYLGADANVAFVDAVRVGKPALEGISYANPFETLFWGFDKNSEGGHNAMMQDIAIYPVYSPMTWMDMSPYVQNATYAWAYQDPETHEDATAEGPELTLSFVPDYTSDKSKQTNIYSFPALTVSAPGTMPGSYQAPYTAMSAGGKPEMTFSDGNGFAGGILPFALNNDEFTHFVIDWEKYGDYDCPIFGHDKYTDKWWLEEYSLRGDEPSEGEYSRLLGIINFIYPTEKPLVVNGVTVYGYGKIKPEAEFTISIYALPPSMVFLGDETPIATATATGADVFTEDANYRNNLYIPFTFDTPAVVKKTEETPFYIIMFSGFNSDAVDYFAPMQSLIPHLDLCHGWVFKENYINETYGKSLTPIANIEGEYGECRNAFAIQLEGEYPWLTCDTKSIELGTEPVQVALGSYFDGSKLTVEAPEGVTATVEGRYDECVLTATHTGGNAVDGNIVVKGPGVEATIAVKASAGIADIEADANATVTDMFDLSGRRVDAAAAAPGVYVVKLSDGTVRKTVVR